MGDRASQRVDAGRRIRVKRRGNALGFWFFRMSLRAFGLRGAYGLLYPVCAYYLFADRAAARSASAYLRRRFPSHGRPRRLLDRYRLLLSQGRSLIDRHVLLAGGGGLRLRLEGEECLAGAMRSPKGFVLLTAHLGNWQAVMACLKRLRRTVHLVMRPEDNPAVAESLRIGGGEDAVEIISPEGHLGGAVAIMKALQRGGIVSIMGDRSYGFSAVTVPFLGAPARLSCGGFHIAATAGCPVVILTSAKTSSRDYVVRVAGVWHPRYEFGRPKREQRRRWVRAFAGVIEAFVEAYPYQCFLFHDVWAEARGEGTAPGAAGDAGGGGRRRDGT